MTLPNIDANTILIIQNSPKVKHIPLAAGRGDQDKKKKNGGGEPTLMYFRNSIAFTTRNGLKFQAVVSQSEEKSWLTLNFMQLSLKSHKLSQ